LRVSMNALRLRGSTSASARERRAFIQILDGL